MRWSPIATVVLMLLTAAGCGGGESPPAETPAPSPGTMPGSGSESGRVLEIPGSDSSSGSGELPAGHPPLDGSSGLPPVTGVGGLSWTAPDGWVAETPSNNMRQAQYKVPGPGGDAECVVFYFGTGQGGDPMSNAVRWAGQFSQPDGRESAEVLRTSEMKAGDIDVLLVEVTGTYTGMTMGLEPPEPRPGYMLLGSVVEGPDAPWFFKLTGPEETVRAGTDAFEAMMRSLKTDG